MKYRVHVVRDAEEDMLDIWRYVALSGSAGNAENLLDEFEHAITSLERMPERGHIPPELKRVNVHAYREIHVKIYRIILPDHRPECVRALRSQREKGSPGFASRAAAEDSEVLLS